MAKKQKAFNKLNLISTSVWLAIALCIFIFGLIYFLEQSAIHSDDLMMNYFFWGILCAFPILSTIIKMIKDKTKEGWNEGANTYTAEVSSSGVTVKNHPLSQALWGLFFGVIGSVCAGPFILLYQIIVNIIFIVRCSLFLNAKKKETLTNYNQNNNQNQDIEEQ